MQVELAFTSGHHIVEKMTKYTVFKVEKVTRV